MLVNFNIDPDAIDDSTNEYHVKELRNKWQQSGILAHPSYEDGSLSLISRRFLELNQEKRSLWDDAWQEIENNPTRYLRCKDNFSVALVSEARARSRGIPHGDSGYFGSSSLGNVEWIRLKEINASIEFGQCEELSRKRIEINDLVVDLWQERFQQLARHASEVVVVDEWAVRNNTIDGLARFLELLDGDAKGCDVTIYSSPETELQEEVVTISSNLSNLTAQLSAGGINGIEVRLRPEDDFRLYAHERHIRFDNRVVSVGRGLRTFQHETVREATDTSLALLLPNTHEGKENDLDEKAYRLSDFCLPIGTP